MTGITEREKDHLESRELVQMNEQENRNRKIIDAVIRKEQAVCPGQSR